jgi:hypothetical protein
MKTKTEKYRLRDEQHPASNYLVVTDPDDTDTWHLRVRNTFGQLDFKLMGEAWAALHGGFRGNKYEGPDKDGAIQKLTKLYHSANMRTPDGQEPPRAARNRAGQFVIFNRATKSREGWIHIVPRGELPNAEAKVVQVLDDPALDSIFNRLQTEHGAAGAPGLYAGREHFIYDPSKDSEALAWFKTFNRDNDGIWASADGLTDIGREAVRNRRYKFTSFVADGSDLKKVEGNRYRVMGIETVGFTNMANGRELLTPIMNRQGDEQLNAEGQTVQPTYSGGTAERSAQIIDSADPLTPEQRSKRVTAYEKWFETIGNAQRTARKTTGHSMSFQWLWDHCKAEYPHVYEAAFGKITDDAPASSEAEADARLQDVANIANRVGQFNGKDVRWGWKFVQEHLPQVFNRQFTRHAPIANRTQVDGDNMAGVQKKAEKLFSELVQREQTQSGVPFSQAFTLVTNREKTLRDLANYTIAPREAFERAPGLREKLLGTAGENKTPDDATVQANSTRLFNRLVQEELNTGASQPVAFRRVQAEHTILCKLVNREITPKGALALEPELRAKLT